MSLTMSVTTVTTLNESSYSEHMSESQPMSTALALALSGTALSGSASLAPSLFNLVSLLQHKYKDNEYMSTRLYHHLETLLPSTLESEHKVQQQREERKRQLSDKRDEFTERFMHTHRYFYCPHSELFIHYDGTHFQGYSEDEILHKIHSMIVNEPSYLMAWKHKIKNNIMKQVREKSLFTSIPESETIQSVLNSFYPAIFPTRNHSKYFLTIIGECIMSCSSSSSAVQQQTITYITSPNMKILFDEIAGQLDTYLGYSYPFHNIKFKYYDHNYAKCRLIHCYKKPFSIPYKVSKYMFDLLCVSTHYYSRYGSPDNFLSQCGDTELVDYANLLCNNTPDKIVDMFLEAKISHCPSGKINSKNMLFIWKKYLEERNIPNIILHGPLKNILKQKIAYIEETDMFNNVTSIHLPVVSQFIHFWDTYITEEDDTEIEVDELLRMFRKSSKTNQMQNNIADTLMIELVKHYYPDIEIVEDKYILNVRCSLWDKRSDVIVSLELFCNNEVQSIKSLYDAYEFYSYMNQNNDCIVSKRYFEKVAKDVLGENLDKDGIIICCK